MPVHWAIEGDVLTLTFEGEYTFAEIAAAAQAGFAAAFGRVRLLVDATRTARLPDSQGVQQRIALLRELTDRLAGTAAIVATPGAMYGIARQIAQQAETSDAVAIQVFETLPEARRWLAGEAPK